MYNTRIYSGSSLDISNGNPYQREVRQREAEKGLAFRLSFLHHIFIEEGGFGYITVAVSRQDVQARKQKCSFLVMAYIFSTYFIKYLKL
jgi:hypothetical protein